MTTAAPYDIDNPPNGLPLQSKLRARPSVQAQVLRQDGDGVWHVRVLTGDGNTLASQLVALGLGRLATAVAQVSGELVT